MRLIPRSLIGRIALAMALVLLVAQGISFALLQRERERLVQAQVEGPAVARFVTVAGRLASGERLRPLETRRGRIGIGTAPAVATEASDEELAARIRDSAALNNLEVREVRAAISDDLPPVPARAGGGARSPEREQQRAERFQSLVFAAQLPDGRWVNAQLAIARPSRWPFLRLALGTGLIYLALLGAVLLVAARLTRPLRDLARAAERFGRTGQPEPVEARGPVEVERAVHAFNAMGERIGGLIEEKDRMLGAIGHDLRTPLASLRIRAESVEPESERERMVATIEEMAAMLDDTLALARSGRSSEPQRAVDVTALVDAVAEEFRELGADVVMDESPRSVARVRPDLLRRAVRNLADNAVKYAGSASLSVRAEGEEVLIEVADRGPGIPAARLGDVQEPFVRLERSRSRATGGSGLGITLAKAAATLHEGQLELENRPGGGLIARLRLPSGIS